MEIQRCLLTATTGQRAEEETVYAPTMACKSLPVAYTLSYDYFFCDVLH